MENRFDISDKSETEIHEIARDILNNAFGYQLEYRRERGMYSDLLFNVNKNGRAEVFAEVKWENDITAKSTQKLIQEQISLITMHECSFYILLSFKKIDKAALDILDSYLKKIRKNNFRFSILDINWIHDQLLSHPVMADKHFPLKETSSIPIDDVLPKESSLPTDDNEMGNELEMGKGEMESLSIKEQVYKLSNSGKHFFAAGHTWGNIDMYDNFIINNRWENGHEDKLINVVNRARKGDVVFLKSTHAGDLIIKAIGIVTENIEDGHELSVKWQEINNKRLSGLGGTRYAFNQIGENNVPRVIEALAIELPDLFEIIRKLEREDEFPIDLDVEYFSNKYSAILQSEEFYFVFRSDHATHSGVTVPL